jgi:hypothetical protein
MTVQAVLFLSAITEHHWGGKLLRFEARYDESIPEDKRFQKATPSASAEFMIDNPSALEQFNIGQSYYVDFTPAPNRKAHIKQRTNRGRAARSYTIRRGRS